MVIFRFNVSERLSFLEENLPRFSEADLFVIPSDSVFSDADSDDEDEPQSMNYFSSSQLSVSTEVVFRTAYQESEISESEKDDV